MENKKLTNQQKLSRRKLRRPPAIPYILLAGVWKLIYFKKLGVKVDYQFDKSELKSPHIIVSNHASRLDYIYTALALLPYRLNFVSGYNEFFRSHLAFIFRFFQVIPKRNFVPDVYTIKESSRILKSGGSVVLFPEGMSSISGANQPVAIGSGKFIKHFGLPVIYCRISGGYLTSTKYCLDERPGRVDVTIGKLFTPEQLKDLSPAEIDDILNRTLYNDDYEWNKTARASYKGKGRMAQNLHNLLYLCPKCGAEFKNIGSGDTITCSQCGNTVQLTESYELKPAEGSVAPETPRVWFDFQRERVKREIADPDFSLTERIRLGALPEYEYLKNQATSEIVGEGTLTLTHKGLSYTGSRRGEPFEFFIDIRHLPTYGMCTDVSRFYTFYKGDFYEFYPENPTVEKWFLATEELHRLHGGAWQDFSWKIGKGSD